MFAVVEIAGKQYKVREGDILFTEKLDASEGETVTFDKILAYSDDQNVSVGSPALDGAKITASVVRQGKDKKIYVMTYKSKKNEKKKQGHRQPYTKIQIQTITV